MGDCQCMRDRFDEFRQQGTYRRSEMEAMLAFGKPLARFPNFERAGPTVRPPRWRFRVIDELKVDLKA